VLTIANRENDDPEAVEAQLGRPLDNTRTVSVRNGVASIPIEGPIFRRANLFTEISGGASVEIIARDLNKALDDQSVRAVMLVIDSPGGEVNGINELADMLYAARGRKPITAYVEGVGASAAYWIASAADEVVADATAALGSIGVIMTMRDPSKTSARDIEFVSSQSPNKNPNPATESGRSQIQSIVDSLADVFVSTVARNRSVSRETVLSDFGQGGILIGQKAVDAGLADRLGSYEQVLAELSDRTQPRYFTTRGSTNLVIGEHASNRELVSSGAAMVGAPNPAQKAKERIMSDELNTAPEEHTNGATNGGAALSPFPPLSLTDSTEAQAQLRAYAAEMRTQFSEERKRLLAEAQEQVRREIAIEIAEERAQQAITRYAQDVTTATLHRSYALPLDTERLVKHLTSLNASQRTEAQALFDHILTAGLINFEEIGSSAEAEIERSAIERYEEAVNAKVAGGMTRYAAISAIRADKPDLVEEYNAAKAGSKKGGR
jgi:signal peptide peptidase SppA